MRPSTRQDKDTPLHIAVRYANEKDEELGTEMVKMMCEAGCDPRVRNKHGQKPADLVFNKPDIKQTLQQAEYILAEGIQNDGDEDMGDGSASDSE
jgi:Ankyrin repeat.